ncbi:DUF2029 domain-containing protein [Motilibacter sp. E257]|uniref:DUF2029 domain-containing protein n=1 Tax=Motilibacter deserti TaxID=2714956 RepID=A0ABX0GVB3_9ACTN|nr:glycosyltransferase 87 family protein [Motilibacter deserti]NHC14091.1 DUF2029 domain-containing protein [Motilibacter deserti]
MPTCLLSFPRGVRVLLAIELVALVVFAAVYESLDFSIYRGGGAAVLQDAQLYLAQIDEHWFTYPPFAALLFTPLTWVPETAARLCWDLASVAALAYSCRVGLRLAGLGARPPAVLAAVAATLLLEPVWHTLFLGQVNLLLMALVLRDVERVSSGRPAGMWIGLAAAVKLTPAVFVLLLLAAGRARSARNAVVAFVAASAAAWALAPGASATFWGRYLGDTSRVGATYVSNQSPFGVAARVFGRAAEVPSAYLLLPALAGALGLALAAAYARREDWLAAVVVTAATGLAVSPISWTHHWVWVVPALALLLREGRRRAALAGFALFAAAPMWWAPGPPREPERPAWWLSQLVADAYLVAAVLLLLLLARVPGPALARVEGDQRRKHLADRGPDDGVRGVVVGRLALVEHHERGARGLRGTGQGGGGQHLQGRADGEEEVARAGGVEGPGEDAGVEVLAEAHRGGLEHAATDEAGRVLVPRDYPLERLAHGDVPPATQALGFPHRPVQLEDELR